MDTRALNNLQPLRLFCETGKKKENECVRPGKLIGQIFPSLLTADTEITNNKR